MNIPVKGKGNTSLAYITNEERKLLRRRDAVKGSPNKKMDHGLPSLRGGGDHRVDLAAEKARRAKEKALMDAGFTKEFTGGGSDKGSVTKYVHKGKGLAAGEVGSPSTPYKYGTRDYETMKFAKPILSAIVPTSSSTTPATSSKPKPPKKKPLPTGPGHGLIDTDLFPVTSTPPETTDTSTTTTSTIDSSQLQQPMLDEIVAEGVNSELLETRLTNLINKNNPLFKAATTRAMQSMAARGLVNSSIAEEAVMNAILSVAIPIAERDANAYMNQRMQNQAYSNEFKAQQNKAYYESFLMKLQNSMDMAMRQLSEKSANWRAVLAARSNITTTPGMSADATAAGMAAVTPDWWNA